MWCIPQFSLLSGNRCSGCHVVPQGGGVRNDLGWYSYQDVGFVSRESIPWLYPEDQENSFFDGMLVLGTDIRVQATRSLTDSNASRLYIPMQATVYGAVRPWKGVTIEGGFNLASLRTSEGQKVRFPGQRPGSISLILQPNTDLPSVRVGMFRPSIGVRYDDHTVFPVSYLEPSARRNYLAPDWGEWGSELTWEREKWLTVQLGIFGSEGLSQVTLSDGLRQVSAISGNMPTITGRVVAWPRFADNAVNTYAGGSVLINNDFQMVRVFAGGGLTDALYLMLEVTRTEKTDVLQSTMFMTELGWQITPPLIAYIRYERGSTKQKALESDAQMNSVIIGAQVFVMPFVELRPEYRLLDTFLDGVATRWNLQLHIFY
jgi:hypothetical protein